MNFKKKAVVMEYIFDLIDDNMDNCENITIVCNKDVVENIADILDNYEFKYKNCRTRYDVDEYLLTMNCDQDDNIYDLFVESLRGESGEVKGHETAGDVIVIGDFDMFEITSKIEGESYSLYELVEDDKDIDECDEDCECDCECTMCNHTTEDEVNEIVEYLAKVVEDIIDTEGCRNCIFDIVSDVYFQGYEDAKEDCDCDLD